MTGSVARVVVDVSLPHLDRLFDYSVPDALDEQALPGVRVRVRFAGRLVDGFVVDRVAASEHARLQPLQRVVSTLPVLQPQVLHLCREVADRYAGTVADVLRSAVPPRHARAESAVLATDPQPLPVPPADVSAWSEYSGGAALARRVSSGDRGLRAVWTCAPGGSQVAKRGGSADPTATQVAKRVGSDPTATQVAKRGGSADPTATQVAEPATHVAGDWAALSAGLAACAAERSGAIIVVPDARDIDRVQAAVVAAVGPGRHATLAADLGPQRRYAEFLRILTGRVRIVIGTRSAAFAPLPDPGLLLLWDDGDESLSEPHAPGWHAREVLALRSHLTGAPLVVGGFTRTAETQSWIEAGWAGAVAPSRSLLTRVAPRVTATEHDGDAGPARLPRRAWEAAKSALETGPVLVQVSRRGYVPGLACQGCRAPARCPSCAGPLALAGAGSAPTCRWCATRIAPWHCPQCGDARLRAMSVGSARTAEELGRAFPGVPVVVSGGERVVDAVTERPALVVATPGAEPTAAGGYAAVLLLDASAQLARVALRAGEETARRWFAAAALARPRGTVVVTTQPSVPAVQALVRWDPGWLASRELAEREALGMPPAVRSAVLTGSPAAVDAALEQLPSSTRVIGPLPVGGTDRSRALLTCPRGAGTQLAEALHALAAARTARKDPEPLEHQVDPLDWGGD